MATVTAATVRAAVKAASDALGTHTWYSVWSPAKDRDTNLVYPCVMWKDWTSRHPEDALGLLQHVQLVQLLVCATVDSDRSAAERDAAVEASHAAAIQIVQGLRAAGELAIGNVSITTQWDEFTTLETGVILTFTATGYAACLTPPED